jgi:hypothetical protein
MAPLLWDDIIGDSDYLFPVKTGDPSDGISDFYIPVFVLIASPVTKLFIQSFRKFESFLSKLDISLKSLKTSPFNESRIPKTSQA